MRAALRAGASPHIQEKDSVCSDAVLCPVRSAGRAGKQRARDFLPAVCGQGFHERHREGPGDEGLISQGYYTEAYDMVCRYGSEEMGTKELRELVIKMLLDSLLREDQRLLSLSFQVFLAGQAESTILDYLCEYFNGTVDQMFNILLAGIREQVDTADMEERLLCQMLFTGCTEKMDRVFDLYASRKRRRN